MTKEEIINNLKFRQRCEEYGLDFINFEIYDDVILVNTKTCGLYILFDQNFNTIDVVDWSRKIKFPVLSKAELVDNRYYEYCNFSDILPFGEDFGYPFSRFTLKHFIDIGDKIEISNIDSKIKINDMWYEKKEEYKTYFELLSYIKFISLEIKEYFLISYHMKTLGIEIDHVYSYVKNLINKINDCIDLYFKQNINPTPDIILNVLGQNHKKLEYDYLLLDTIKLLIKDKKSKTKKDIFLEINKFNFESTSKLNSIARELIKLIDNPENYQDIKAKESKKKLLKK